MAEVGPRRSSSSGCCCGPSRAGEAPAASATRTGTGIAGATRSLPALITGTVCGHTINFAKSGVEAKLIDFVNDKTRPIDDKTWFTFDRLEFETASANLGPVSSAQVQNIAEIMKCYPTLNLKVGGYTDNVGDPAANLHVVATARGHHRAGHRREWHLRITIERGRLRRAVSGGQQRQRGRPAAQPPNRPPSDTAVIIGLPVALVAAVAVPGTPPLEHRS